MSDGTEGTEKLFICNYELLCVVGGVGVAETKLHELPGLYAAQKGPGLDLEFSDVLQESDGDLLGIFCAESVLEAVLAKSSDGTTSFGVAGLDQTVVSDLAAKFCHLLKLRTYINSRSRKRWIPIAEEEAKSYRFACSVAEKRGEPLGAIFSALQYASFLHIYKHKNTEQALAESEKRFGIKTPFERALS